jgi:hypothetical protein
MKATAQTPGRAGTRGIDNRNDNSNPIRSRPGRQDNSADQYPIQVRLDPKNRPQLTVDLFVIEHAIKRHSKDPSRARLVVMLRKLWLTILKEIGPEWGSYRHAWENRP